MLSTEELGGMRRKVIQSTAQWVSGIRTGNNRRRTNDEQEREETSILTYS